MTPDQTDPRDDVLRIPLVEEDARIAINRMRTEQVRIETRTELRDDWVKAELRHSDVEITTVPVNKQISQPPDIRVEGDTTIIPILEERLVIEKRLFLKEELHVTRRSVVETVNEPVQLREQHVSVQRIEETKEKQQ